MATTWPTPRDVGQQRLEHAVVLDAERLGRLDAVVAAARLVGELVDGELDPGIAQGEDRRRALRHRGGQARAIDITSPDDV